MEEIVLVHLADHVELGRVAASVTRCANEGAQDSRRQDSLARIGKHDVVVCAMGELKAALAHRELFHVQVIGNGDGIARLRKAIVKRDNDTFHNAASSPTS